jgi:hypothetical protein
VERLARRVQSVSPRGACRSDGAQWRRDEPVQKGSERLIE